MNRIGLTERQADLLAFIESRVAAGLPTPSFDEMRRHLGLSAKSGIHRIITCLEERGYVVRMHRKARSIGLVSVGLTERPPIDEPRYTVPAPVADRLDAYCRRHRVPARDVLSAALEAYMEVHQ